MKKIGGGDAGNQILEEAEKERSDLIVMSTHGRTGLAHVLCLAEHEDRRR